MYKVNPRLCGLAGEVGVLAPGTSADIVVTGVDPLDNLAALSEPETALDVVLCRGRLAVDRL